MRGGRGGGGCGEVEKRCSPQDEERSLEAGTGSRFKIWFLRAEAAGVLHGD